MVSNVAPSYAPAGKHLLSCTVLGDPGRSDEELAQEVRSEMASHFPAADAASWQLLRVYRVRAAQYAQPAGIWEHLPEGRTPRPGLILAGEITVSSSLHGALVSGQRAAGLAMSVKGLSGGPQGSLAA
jgi:phytoene dehydrogenase-like protein